MEGLGVPERASDGYLDATILCEKTGKSYDAWWSDRSTQESIRELATSMNMSVSTMIKVEDHTWVHDKVAHLLCMWASHKYRRMINTLMNQTPRMKS